MMWGFFWGVVLQVIQPLVQQPSLPVVKQSVKERLGPVPASNIEPAEAQGANTEVTQVCMIVIKSVACFSFRNRFRSVLNVSITVTHIVQVHILLPIGTSNLIESGVLMLIFLSAMILGFLTQGWYFIFSIIDFYLIFKKT